FKSGLFVPGRSAVGLQRGGQFPQELVRISSGICLSDEVLGDQLTLVGIGVDPAAVLGAAALTQWEAAGAHLLHLGMRGQTGNGTTRFAEIMGNSLVLNAPQGWLAVVRPDRVVMHDGPPPSADMLVRDSLRVL
ncbi:MAG: 3-(3-hydroxyphenyl)propionate hydroxylase, partial [Pseudomonadota bacterium]